MFNILPTLSRARQAWRVLRHINQITALIEQLGLDLESDVDEMTINILPAQKKATIIVAQGKKQTILDMSVTIMDTANG